MEHGLLNIVRSQHLYCTAYGPFHKAIPHTQHSALHLPENRHIRTFYPTAVDSQKALLYGLLSISATSIIQFSHYAN